VSPKRFNLASVDWVGVTVYGVLLLSIGACLYGFFLDPPR